MHKAQIVALFDWLVPPMLRVALKQIRSPLPMQDINMVISLMRLFTGNLDEFAGNAAGVAELSEQQQATWLQCLFLFGLVWAIGGNTDEEGRHKFDAQLRKVIVNDPAPDLKPYITGAYVKVGGGWRYDVLVPLHSPLDRRSQTQYMALHYRPSPLPPYLQVTVPFPEGKLVHDFMFDKDKSRWVPWLDTIDSKALDPDLEYTNIIVPTVDTVRYSYLLDKYVQHNVHCLFVGPTGTGKSVYVKRHLQVGRPPGMASSIVLYCTCK